MVFVEETSATIACRIGKYRPIEKPDNMTQGIRSIQLLARAYISGGKEASNVPNTCSRFLPYLSDRYPLRICMTAVAAFDKENTMPSSVIDALRELLM